MAEIRDVLPEILAQIVSNYVASVVEENESLENPFVPSNRYAVASGSCEVKSERQALFDLHRRLQPWYHQQNAVLIGHTLFNDIKWLEERWAVRHQAPFRPLFDGLLTIDVALIGRAMRNSFQSMKLAKIGECLGVDFVGEAHNASNDAAHTLDIFLV
ncbi:hypothetical protein EK21DRAFT_114867 [Setomelanomma holmii]|uniref:Gfd2/YDR514C-like C-terminal domain-containing protein n=1 Tax=Setomelanomma holmii TaxID=210430 RepID=A0A9P4H4F5_9PLEO|nr:hypothetical protein EK21DRAFT_114867 [Setomelanomma holmii]